MCARLYLPFFAFSSSQMYFKQIHSGELFDVGLKGRKLFIKINNFLFWPGNLKLTKSKSDLDSRASLSGQYQSMSKSPRCHSLYSKLYSYH